MRLSRGASCLVNSEGWERQEGGRALNLSESGKRFGMKKRDEIRVVHPFLLAHSIGIIK